VAVDERADLAQREAEPPQRDDPVQAPRVIVRVRAQVVPRRNRRISAIETDEPSGGSFVIHTR